MEGEPKEIQSKAKEIGILPKEFAGGPKEIGTLPKEIAGRPKETRRPAEGDQNQNF